MAFVEAIVVLALLYFIGRSVYGKRTNRKFSLLSVLVDFFIIMVTNAVIMLLVLAVLALLIGSVGLMFGDSDEFFFVGVNERVATGQLLLLTLIVILATAILQFHLRKRLPSKVQTLLHMSDEDYVICEYYIQWVTFYLVVYQIVFNGFSSVLKALLENQSIEHYFSVILSPSNINLVMQPVLIASWVAVVMEKIHHARTKTVEDGDDPADTSSGVAPA